MVTSDQKSCQPGPLIITNGDQVSQSHWIPNSWLREKQVFEHELEYASKRRTHLLCCGSPACLMILSMNTDAMKQVFLEI
jgi:hypothetical protein